MEGGERGKAQEHEQNSEANDPELEHAASLCSEGAELFADERFATMKTQATLKVGDAVPQEVVALGIPFPALVIWLRHVG
jgi:hypothetical protein